MNNEDYTKKRDEILAKLVSDITITGYGKKDQPNPLIQKRDKQPFAGYEFCQDKAAQAIDALVLEVIGDSETDKLIRPILPFQSGEAEINRYNKAQGRDWLRHEQRRIVQGDRS